ncbi:hypothetical protein MVEN_01587500 [Mycena venus]|uniref:F-box domain-containing protein n=1 Tax=Mycena venus TaxID=2733690 RepID=A0A8H6XR89_9AGAR|nr:hypothetical protein MVEN_01587500 [Mycena venus]
MSESRCSACGAGAAGPVLEKRPDFELPPRGTRYLELLSSNDPPEDSDLDVVHSALSITHARLSLIDEEIARVRERLRQLEEEREILLNFRAKNRGILSPLRKMPSELLSEIFSWTLPSARNSSLRRGFHTRESPWVLTHVSRQWRAVAVSNPSLWSLITITYQAHTNPSSLYPLPMVETQLARAQKLNLHFFGSETADSSPQLEIFRCLANHVSQWEQLSLQLTSDLFPYWDRPGSQANTDALDCFQTAPSLIDIGIYNEFRMIPISLPVQQLTRYEHDAPWAIHEGILKLAPSLVEAHISIKFDEEPWPPTTLETIDLPSLRRLYITAAKVVDYIRVPVLDDLVLACRGPDESFIVSALQSLITRSSCSLRCLCFTTWSDVPTAVTILHDTPSIIELRIIVTQFNSHQVRSLLEALTTTEDVGSEVVAPQLRSISLGCPERRANTNIECDMYSAMVKSRWKAEYCSLTMSSILLRPGPPQAVVLCDLNRLREEGLDFVSTDGVDASDVMDYWLCRSRY